jgi:hypothetical protein
VALLQDTSTIAPGQSLPPDLPQGPFPEVSPSAFFALLALGFAIGAIGKLYDWRPAIALGIMLIVIAVLVLPIVLFISGQGA